MTQYLRQLRGHYLLHWSAFWYLARAAIGNLGPTVTTVTGPIPLCPRLFRPKPALLPGEPKYQTQSNYCRIRKELRWWDSPSLSNELGGELTIARFGEYRLHTIVLKRSLDPNIRIPKNSSIEILDKILAKAPVSQQQNLQRQVNGVIGAANNYPEAQESVAALHGLLKQRFLGKSNLAIVTRHRLFPQFLEAKAHELYQRRHPAERTKRKSRR